MYTKNKVKASKKRIYIVYNQILEKVKGRQRFCNAPPCGIRKKSGRMILEHLDLLKEIYGDSPLKVSILSRPNTDSVNAE